MKSSTDTHWNERAKTVSDIDAVNIVDVFQRNVEHQIIRNYLSPSMRLLEVGCGNGFSTAFFRELVKHVDAFDYSENMIESAKKCFGEKNNRFFIDNVLSPKKITGTYDAVVCVRVLINLENLQQQIIALENIASFLNSNGCCILVEGFTDGFEKMNELRKKVSLSPLEPAKINYYSSFNEIMPTINQHFFSKKEFHLGCYDFLTRIVYPLVAGAENVRHNTIFSEKSEMLANVFNPDCFKEFSRIKGLLLIKR